MCDIDSIKIPDGYKLVKVGYPKDKIVELETTFSTMTEPTDKELIQLGKETHHYYVILEFLSFLKKDM